MALNVYRIIELSTSPEILAAPPITPEQARRIHALLRGSN